MDDGKLRFAFCFPMATGHLNPSLPVAQALRNLGHEVHYLSRKEMEPMIQSTGATFTDVASQQKLEKFGPAAVKVYSSLNKRSFCHEKNTEREGEMQNTTQVTIS